MIMAADVVGYSRLMAAAEAVTFAQLKTHRREVIEPKVVDHHGRVVKLAGDGGFQCRRTRIWGGLSGTVLKIHPL
jgi:class 3 adenylate cyclase